MQVILPYMLEILMIGFFSLLCKMNIQWKHFAIL